MLYKEWLSNWLENYVQPSAKQRTYARYKEIVEQQHVDDETLGENKIAQVFSKGYRMGDRIIRHAVVTVAN